MQQVLSIWSGLDGRRRGVAALAAVAMFVAVFGLARIASSPGTSLLYAGLDPGAAGDVVSALEQRGVTYDVRGGSIFVDSARRDELRMTLASEGLPANGAAGYELLDTLSGFGTTSQMFDAAYWRAKEGELARTIVASPQVRAARVHISNPGAQPFRRDIAATASVTVTPAGAGLSTGHARALRYLVASAVAGLSPDQVSVIDGQGGQILGVDDTAGASTVGGDRAAEMKAAVERMLEARVGFGNAVVEISIETVTESESIVERRFDPDTRVAISTDTEERSGTAEDGGNGAVTVASNLPDGDAAAGGSSSTSQNSETRERVNYEVSETQREILKIPGAIKRLTIAVLVNGVADVDTTGAAVTVPRAEEELQALRELVASAVGLDESRGDVLTLKSMGFEPLEAAGTTAAAGILASLNLNLMTLVQLVILALVALILGLFVLRPILLSPPRRQVPELAPPRAANTATSPAPSGQFAAPVAPGLPGAQQVLSGEIDDSFVPGNMAVVSDFDLPDGISNDPVKRLRELIEDRQDETVEVLRSWMEDKQESA